MNNKNKRNSLAIIGFSLLCTILGGLLGFSMIQVFGKYNTTPLDKLKLDLTYIEKYNLLLDLKIILLTIKILFQKENTEGIDAWQTTAIKDNVLNDNQQISINEVIEQEHNANNDNECSK